MAEMSRELALPVLLRDLQGFSYDEAATALGIPMGTLKSRLVRARRELAQRVAGLLEPASPLAPKLQAAPPGGDLAGARSC